MCESLIKTNQLSTLPDLICPSVSALPGPLQSLSSGVNFINILRAAFTCADTKSAKNTENLTAFFALSGSRCVKAALNVLVKFTPDLLVLLGLTVPK